MQNVLKPREHKKELENAMEEIVLDPARKQGTARKSVRLISTMIQLDKLVFHINRGIKNDTLVSWALILFRSKMQGQKRS